MVCDGPQANRQSLVVWQTRPESRRRWRDDTCDRGRRPLLFGLRVVLDGGGGSISASSSRRRRGRSGSPSIAARSGPTRRAPRQRRQRPQPAAAPVASGDARPRPPRPAVSPGTVAGLPRSAARRPLQRAADPHRLAGRRAEAAVEAAGRRRLRVVRRANGRAFTIEQRGAQEVVGRLRRPDRPRAVDQRVGRATFTRVDGRRRSARDADVVRRHALRARRDRRAPRAGRVRRPTLLAHEHPRRRRRRQPSVGHVGVAADRRRYRRRPAGRRRTADRSSPTTARRGRAAWSALDDEASYSSPMLRDARRRAAARWCSARSRLIGLTPDRGKLLWEHPVDDAVRRATPSQPLVIGDNRVFVSTGYGIGRGADRDHRGRRPVLASARSGGTSG